MSNTYTSKDTKERNISIFLNDFADVIKSETGELLISSELLAWLDEHNFFVSPAAIKYHGNYTGGLFEHSFAVAQKLVELTKQLNLSWQNPRSPYIVGMFHDLCKVDDYRVEGAALDSEEYVWGYNNDKILKGHGDKSIMFLSQFLTLTEEEILCIRYHMGAYETDDWDSYDKAIKKYENVLWTHTADMWVSKVLNT